MGPALQAVLKALDLHDAGPAGAWALALVSGMSFQAEGLAPARLELMIRPVETPMPAQAAHWLQRLQQVCAPWQASITLELAAGAVSLAEDRGQAHGFWRIPVRGEQGERQLSWDALQSRIGAQPQAVHQVQS